MPQTCHSLGLYISEPGPCILKALSCESPPCAPTWTPIWWVQKRKQLCTEGCLCDGTHEQQFSSKTTLSCPPQTVESSMVLIMNMHVVLSISNWQCCSSDGISWNESFLLYLAENWYKRASIKNIQYLSSCIFLLAEDENPFYYY